MDNEALHRIEADWRAAWPEAVAAWSPFVKLSEPLWCFSVDDEHREHLSGSFAMIRLHDHSVVVSVAQIAERGLEQYAIEILAHEVGHHVYCPADLADQARLIARIRHGLPAYEDFAPLVANLYADLLINDHLQRQRGRDLAGVYQVLKSQFAAGSLWQWYMRTYELLWSLPPMTLTSKPVSARSNQDALLGARLIRVYRRDWLAGAGRFACLVMPYIAEEAVLTTESTRCWSDTMQGGSSVIPDGLTELDADERSGVLHPAEDPQLSGISPLDPPQVTAGNGGLTASSQSGHHSSKSFRDPFEYAAILKAAGVKLDERQIAVKYYRERALPYLVPFPAQVQPPTTEWMPEGLGIWHPDDELDRLDWFSTLVASPVVIPGVTTRERLQGEAPGSQPERMPLNLYLGVDCSGSMSDPAYHLSFPVLAGTIVAMSALRAAARVKVVLSGEPGQSVSTDGFIRDQREVLRVLLNYLGTGYSFGIHRLEESFPSHAPIDRPAHILIVSDFDIFAMLDQTADERLGWDVARDALHRCRGGGTYVLQLPGYEGSAKNPYTDKIERMKSDGWNVHPVNSMEELLVFARDFSRRQYSQDLPKGGRRSHAH